jgi:hypothetical protein
MVSVQARRDAVAFAMTRGVSQRRACTLLDVARSALGYCSRLAVKDAPVLKRMVDRSLQYPRFGYRRIAETWRRHFNEVRPHSSLGYMTPTEFVASITTNAGPVTATERTAAVCGAYALRSVAQPLRQGQKQKAETAAYSN